MELRNDNRPFESNHPIPLARSARQGMEKLLDEAERSRHVRESALQAAHERIERAREAHAAQFQDLRSKGEARRADVQDRIEISDTARLFVMGDHEGDDEARARLIDSLKAAYRTGNLNTEERVQRAAGRLLGGETEG